VSINWTDHNPPHFHVRYAEYDGSITIHPIRPLDGNLPRRVLSLALEWAALHQEELAENWDRAQQQVPLKKIAPLE
jgi:hypothetical protein